MDQHSGHRFEFFQKVGKNNILTLSSVILSFCILYTIFLINPTYKCNLKMQNYKDNPSSIINNLIDELNTENTTVNTTQNLINTNKTNEDSSTQPTGNDSENSDKNLTNNQNNTTIENNTNTINEDENKIIDVSDENTGENQDKNQQNNTNNNDDNNSNNTDEGSQQNNTENNEDQSGNNNNSNTNDTSNNTSDNVNDENVKNQTDINTNNSEDNNTSIQNETSTQNKNSSQDNNTQNTNQDNSTNNTEQPQNSSSLSSENNTANAADSNAIFYKKRFEIPEDPFKYQMGMTFVDDRYCPHVAFGTARGLYALRQMHAAGVNWVAIVVTEYQENSDSVDIHPVYEPIKLDYYIHNTATIDNLTIVINAAHELGMRVMLKPHIDLYVDRSSGLWRGNIYQQQGTLDQWFESYTAMAVKYAVLAEALDVELFSIQCELQGMNGYDAQWRKVIAEIRYVYNGKLLSAANYGGQEMGTQFWDALDYIGVDAYYFGWNINQGEADYLKSRWNNPFDQLKGLSERVKKPVLISELGYCSGSCGSTLSSPVYAGGLDNQALQFETLLQKIEENTDWLQGIYWWSWFTDPKLGGSEDGCITPHDKPAEEILRKYYKSERPRLETPKDYEQLCECRL